MISLACKRPRRFATCEQGQAILELLPVIVLLLTLTFAVIDFGRAIWQLETITGLTREGSNLASRNGTSTALQDSATAVISDGAALNLSNNGKVIITSVQNQGGILKLTGQYSTGSYSATSKVGIYNPAGTGPADNNPTNFPGAATTILQPGDTIYVTEIFASYAPITPLGIGVVKATMPSILYDVAYF